MSTVAAFLPRRSEERFVLSVETVLAATAAAIITLWFATATEAVLHWFVVPVTVCGALIGGDAIRWARGKIGAFDPAGVLGVVGVHAFFLAPLLHVHWDFWMRYVQPPADWRNWLGAMAIVDCCAIVAYRAGRAWSARASTRLRTRRELDPRRFWIVLVPTLLITAAVQYWVYERVGGLLGYILAYTQPGEAFQGYGLTFLVSESFPILAFLGFAVLTTRYRQLSSWWVIVLVLVAFFALKILFGGLRGSRSNTVWGLFWALGIIHLWIRPLPRRALLAGIPVFTAFMFSYGLYKAAGLNGLSALLDPPRALAVARGSGRTIQSTVLSDLSRADVQAYVLYRLENGGAENRAWGRTYVGGVAILIPRAVLPARPPTKSKEGTDILYGRGTYEAGRSSKRVFGLGGEAMLNVGVAGVPFAFLFFGVFVGWLRRAYYGLGRGDARLLILPLLINLALIMLIGDSDNVVFFFVKEASVPFLLLFFCSRSVRVAAGETKGDVL